MKKITTLFFVILCCITMLKAEEVALTVHVETPGTLADKIFDAGQRPINVIKLTVTGTLNDDDFTCMRETMTSLVDVDLSGITNTTGVDFGNKRNLLKILLPENLTSIGRYTFSNCSSLTSITIPNSVTSIGDYAFSSCDALTSITIPNSVTSIEYSAFKDCSSLTSITIPNSVTSIGSDAFKDCSSLTSITIPNSVTSIGNSAFYGCSSLTSIIIPNSVTSIGSAAFFSCSNIAEIHISDIAKWCDIDFKTTASNPLCNKNACLYVSGNKITELVIPGGVDSIKNYAFYNYAQLTSVTIPNSVTSIGSYAFQGCSSLTSITIPNSVTSIGNEAFYGTPWLSNQPDGCIYINNCLHTYKGEMPENTHIDVKEGTTMIHDYAFYNCSSLTSITIPNSVTSIGERAFSSCSSLTSITIPNSVTSIGGWAFYYCSSLTSISIGNSVTSIGNSAFYHCSRLTSITIPNSVTSIGSNAFFWCSRLTSITIPNSVTSIGDYAFNWCSSLTSIIIPNSVTSIGSSAFYGCSSLTSITCLGSTPPEASDLEANTSTCTLIVPKVAYNSYLRHAYWGQFLNIETIDVDYKKLTVIANNDEWGVVEGGGYYDNGDEATLTATANSGYRFVKWSDEVTDNPRIVVVTQDSTFTAIFEANTFAISTAVNDDAMGSVTEGGEYAYGTEITLTATANSGYRFAQWSDGNTDNPRIVTVTENKTYTAEFEVEVFGVYAAAAVPSMGGVEVILNAKPIEGLVFDHWSDGNTENPRTLTLTEDIELYAYFKVADATNVETSKISSANIYTTNGTLHVENATENYHILDAAGRLIYSGNASTLTLPRGIYLVTINGEVEKIVL